ncbi:MAG TPA: PilN domain-containing protein [Patescibacteria group bacterium]
MKIYLDLLPQDRKIEIKHSRLFAEVLREEILFLLPILLFIFMLASIFYMVKIQHQSSVSTNNIQQSQDKYQQLNTYQDKFKQVNDEVQALTKIQSGHLYWSHVFSQLSSNTPDGILISNISTKDFQVFVIGRAKTRDDLLDFKNKIASSSCFTNINVPLSDLVVKEDVDFQMDFTVSRDCLKK